jgi:hypothetical protein
MPQNQLLFSLAITGSKKYDEMFAKMTEVYNDSIKLLNTSRVNRTNLADIDEVLGIGISSNNLGDVITNEAKVKAMHDYHRNIKNEETFFSLSYCFGLVKLTRRGRKVNCKLFDMSVCGELTHQELAKIEDEKIHLTCHIRFYKDRFVIFAYGIGDFDEC